MLVFRHVFAIYSEFVLLYFVVMNSIYFVLNVVALFSVRRQRTLSQFTTESFYSKFAPPVSVMMPAYNESKTISQSLRGMLLLEYPQFEIVVINDGSTDETLPILMGEFHLVHTEMDVLQRVPSALIRGVYHSTLYPNLVVVDKENGGKADAQNAGINVAQYPLVCVVDADSVIEKDALSKVAWPFLHDPEHVIAAGGTVRLANDCVFEAGRLKTVRVPKSWKVRIQVVEYLRAFMLGRLGWSSMRLLMIISGAFGIFQKEALIAAGGYQQGSLGEDMELLVRLHRHFRNQKKPYRVVFVPDPVCWTEAPEDLKTLQKQRNRWHRGLIDTLRRHKVMMLNPKYGGIGLIAFPYFVFFELLGPVIELFGYIAVPILFIFGTINRPFFFAFLGVALLYGILLSMSAVLIEEISFHRYPRVRDMLIFFLAAVVENLGFRQLTAVWRVRAFYDYFRGNQSWGEMTRKGFTSDGTSVSG